MFILKKISNFYFKHDNFSAAYNYITNALKIDNKEPMLYTLLALYYKENNDTIKFYECSIKEIENSHLHFHDSLLNELFQLNVV